MTELSTLWDTYDSSDSSVVFNRPIDIDSYMNATRDPDGGIIGSKALVMTWLGKVNVTQMGDTGSSSGTGVPVRP